MMAAVPPRAEPSAPATAIETLKKEGLIQLIEFPILKCLPPSTNQIATLKKEYGKMDMPKLKKKAKARSVGHICIYYMYIVHGTLHVICMPWHSPCVECSWSRSVGHV